MHMQPTTWWINKWVGCLCRAVSSAKLNSHGGVFSSKADPYLELSVDGQPPRKTEIIKKTWTPTWNEHFTVYVTSPRQ